MATERGSAPPTPRLGKSPLERQQQVLVSPTVEAGPALDERDGHCIASTLKLQETADFPNVKWWTQKAYDPQSSDLSTIDDDGGDDDDEGPSSKKYKGYPWVEDKDGTPLDKRQSKALAAHPRTALNFVGNKQRAPSQRTDADMEVVKYVRTEMYTAYPDLRLCLHHWKLNAILKLVYPSWKRNWVQGGGHVLPKREASGPQSSGKGKKRKLDAKATGSTVPAKKSKSREPSPHNPDLATPDGEPAAIAPSSALSSSTASVTKSSTDLPPSPTHGSSLQPAISSAPASSAQPFPPASNDSATADSSSGD
ncbi:hypothetical protein R3P38DRAFT_3246151 [Favolaschia claudopus]|uniref:Uncharacterized protein n=1 Tax=Favolaschia claudopus TaxID=2862362 RepID=A0AAV9YZ89_9AGAR